MKKIALALAMLLCLVPVLSACGANSSPEAAAEAAFVAEHIDCDYEAYYEVAYAYNLDLLEEVMGESDDYEDMKADMRDDRDGLKEDFKTQADYMEELEDWDVEYDVRYCISYEKDSDYFDMAMAEFDFDGTDYEDLIDEVAIVGIAAEMYVTDEDGNEFVQSVYEDIICYCIDGSWYVG